MPFHNPFCDCFPDCSTLLLYPAIDAEPDCSNYELYDSQICGIIIAPDGAAIPPDWTDGAAWAALISNANATNDAPHYLPVEGGLPAPEKTILTIGRGIDFVARRRYTLSFTTKNRTVANWSYLGRLACNRRGFAFWYETNGGWLYGGQTGIRANFQDVDFPLDADRAAVERADGILRFDAACAPVGVYVGGVTSGMNDYPNVDGYSPDNVDGYDPDNVLN